MNSYVRSGIEYLYNIFENLQQGVNIHFIKNANAAINSIFQSDFNSVDFPLY